MWMGKMGKDTEAILYVDDDVESKMLLKKLKLSVKRSSIQIVDVGKNSLRGWLLLEYGTMKTPLMVTDRAVISEPQKIIEYILKAQKG